MRSAVKPSATLSCQSSDFPEYDNGDIVWRVGSKLPVTEVSAQQRLIELQ